MKKTGDPHWIRHAHIWGQDEYECSECGAVFGRRYPSCPSCGASLRRVSDREDWLDEAAQADILDDD